MKYLCIANVPQDCTDFYKIESDTDKVSGLSFKFGHLYKECPPVIGTTGLILWLVDENKNTYGIRKWEMHKYFRRFI